MSITRNLNKQQLKALYHTEGPLLILAGAGSGKTRVVTNKIAYLIEEKGIDPLNILAITFTNKAAKEMQSRVGELLNHSVDYMWIGTFHAMCVRILRQNIELLSYPKQFSIYDRDNQITLVKECLDELQLSTEYFKPSSVIARISNCKNAMITPEEVKSQSGNYYADIQFAKIYDLYNRKLKEYGALDFDDLIGKTVELFREFPEVRNRYAKRFKYVFVDEYQDTNLMQYELVKLISSFHNNLTVVGDGDQSIYGWRGADIRNILNFEKDFPEGTTILLEQNYRSSQNILKAANAVISYNTDRKEKNLWSDKEDGEAVEYKLYQTANEEAVDIAEKISMLSSGRYNYDDMAILYRTNAQSRLFEEVFIRKSIPYKIVGGIKFYERKEVRDLLAYLSFIMNPQDHIAFQRIINEPKRSLGKVSVEKIIKFSEDKDINLLEAVNRFDEIDGLNKPAKKGLKQFSNAINYGIEHRDSPEVANLMETVIEKSGLIDALRKDNTIESKTRIENLEEMVSVGASFDEAEPEATLEDFLAQTLLLTDEDKTKDSDKAVTLMTMHSAKGLEFPVVFIVGMEDGLFPSKRALEEEQEEEERRLCYVAITRAEDKLYLSGARSRMVYGAHQYQLPSRFIEELGNAVTNKTDQKALFGRWNSEEMTSNSKKSGFNKYKYTEEKPRKRKRIVVDCPYNVGDQVYHETLGQGMVVEIRDRKEDFLVGISFPDNGVKKFLLSMAPIKKV